MSTFEELSKLYEEVSKTEKMPQFCRKKESGACNLQKISI